MSEKTKIALQNVSPHHLFHSQHSRPLLRYIHIHTIMLDSRRPNRTQRLTLLSFQLQLLFFSTTLCLLSPLLDLLAQQTLHPPLLCLLHRPSPPRLLHRPHLGFIRVSAVLPERTHGRRRADGREHDGLCGRGEGGDNELLL